MQWLEMWDRVLSCCAGVKIGMTVSSINVHVLWSVNTCTTHVPG